MQCVVPSCDTRRTKDTAINDGIKFFSFPKDPVLNLKWLNLCQSKDDPRVIDTKRRVVCMKHFKEDDFKDGLKARLLNFKPRLLKKNAVPSLYMVEELKRVVAPQRAVIAPLGPNGSRRYSKFLEQYEFYNPQPNENSTEDVEATQHEEDSTEHAKAVKHANEKQNTFTEQYVKVLKHDNEIHKDRINVLINTQEKLKMRIKELEADLLAEKEDFIVKVKRVFAHILTSNQVDIVLGVKTKAQWTDVEFTKAYTLHHLSKKSYFYVRDTLNYPLPVTTALLSWASKLGDATPNDDEEETVPPMPKRIRLRLEKIKEEYGAKVEKKPLFSIRRVKEGDESNDNSLSVLNGDKVNSKMKPESEAEYLDKDADESEVNIRMKTNIIFEKDEQDCEFYEQIDYIDDNDIADDNNHVDEYIRSTILINASESRSDNNTVDCASEAEEKVIYINDVDEYIRTAILGGANESTSDGNIVDYDSDVDEKVIYVDDVDKNDEIKERDKYFKECD